MNKNLFHILMVFAMIFWGASWISTKVLTNYVNEYELVFLRMGICFISMFPLIYFFKLSFKNISRYLCWRVRKNTSSTAYRANTSPWLQHIKKCSLLCRRTWNSKTIRTAFIVRIGYTRWSRCSPKLCFSD